MKHVSILVPAAGRASRMRGRDKLLEEVEGVPLLRRQVARAMATGCQVFVTLPPEGRPRRAVLQGLDVRVLTVQDAEDGMAASLRAGTAAAPGGLAVMVLLPDMPDITTQDMDTVLRAQSVTPDQVCRGAAGDVAGHPVILPARLRAGMAELTGDAGARDLIAGEDVALIPLPGCHAVTDLDTPEDWAAWRANRT